MDAPRILGAIMEAASRYTAAPEQKAELVLAELAAAGFVLVDVRNMAGEDLDNALRNFLAHTRPPSGAFGQSMEATQSYEAVVRLRGAAAKHLNRVAKKDA